MDNPVKKKKKSNRCVVCNKKTGIIPYTCKCDPKVLFCTLHRLPESHKCTYDWKKDGQEKLLKENPIIQPEKLEKIK